MHPMIFAFFSGPGFWLLMVAVFVVLELATTALVSIWFVAGAVAALLLSLISPLWWPQWLAFALVSLIAQQLARPLVARMRAKRAPAMNVDRNVGRVATVLTPIGPGVQGRARLDGVDWNALCAAPLEPGDRCLVLQIEGTALVVAPMPATPPPAGPEPEPAREPALVTGAAPEAEPEPVPVTGAEGPEAAEAEPAPAEAALPENGEPPAAP